MIIFNKFNINLIVDKITLLFSNANFNWNRIIFLEKKAFQSNSCLSGEKKKTLPKYNCLASSKKYNTQKITTIKEFHGTYKKQKRLQTLQAFKQKNSSNGIPDPKDI